MAVQKSKKTRVYAWESFFTEDISDCFVPRNLFEYLGGPPEDLCKKQRRVQIPPSFLFQINIFGALYDPWRLP